MKCLILIGSCFSANQMHLYLDWYLNKPNFYVVKNINDWLNWQPIRGKSWKDNQSEASLEKTTNQRQVLKRQPIRDKSWKDNQSEISLEMT